MENQGCQKDGDELNVCLLLKHNIEDGIVHLEVGVEVKLRHILHTERVFVATFFPLLMEGCTITFCVTSCHGGMS